MAQEYTVTGLAVLGKPDSKEYIQSGSKYFVHQWNSDGTAAVDREVSQAEYDANTKAAVAPKPK